MSSGERPIGAAKGKQPNTEALCQTPFTGAQARSRENGCNTGRHAQTRLWLCTTRGMTNSGYTGCALQCPHASHTTAMPQGGRQLDSAKWNTNAAFALHGDKQDRFKLRLSKDKEYDCSLSEEKQRAMTALTFRCFMGMGIKEIAERVVGKEAAKDWGKGRFEKGGQRLEWNPDYNPTQSRLVQSNTADQLNRKLIHSKDRPLNRLEKTELEIFICRYGLSYWQARVALEYALHP